MVETPQNYNKKLATSNRFNFMRLHYHVTRTFRHFTVEKVDFCHFLPFKSPVQVNQPWGPKKSLIKSWLQVKGSISCCYSNMLREVLNMLRAKNSIFANFLTFMSPVQIIQPWDPQKNLVKSQLLVKGSILCRYSNMLREVLNMLRAKNLIFSLLRAQHG